jgi:DNA polymerase-4
MRLDDAMMTCPDLVPVETHPGRYREFHVKLIAVLRTFCDDVLPKSIDEAVIDLTNYQLPYPDPKQLAYAIKRAIREKVGDYLRCSIGIAPNVFLAKLASDVQKPDGLTLITPDTLDGILHTLRLTDLPGIGQRMADRLQKHNINTPIDLRYAAPEQLKAICQSVVGWRWHIRLNFGGEVDLDSHESYKSMSAMRTISAEQRTTPEKLAALLMALCLTLERRMVQHGIFCQNLSFSCRYQSGQTYQCEINLQPPKQDGTELYDLIQQRISAFQQRHPRQTVLSNHLRSINVTVSRFVLTEHVPLNIFENTNRKDKLRQTLYDLKAKFGTDKLIRASELNDDPVYRDVIGFGNINDL